MAKPGVNEAVQLALFEAALAEATRESCASAIFAKPTRLTQRQKKEAVRAEEKAALAQARVAQRQKKKAARAEEKAARAEEKVARAAGHAAF